MNKKNKLSITHCIIAKNEEKSIINCLNSTKNLISEVVIIEDDNSRDNTVKLVREFCYNNNLPLIHEIYKFNNFGEQRNRAIKLATKKWILVIDPDEEFECSYEVIKDRIENYPDVMVWGQPRKCWMDLAKTIEDPQTVGLDDFQHRLFRNRDDIRYVNKVHEYLTYPPKKVYGWMINHFQFVYRTHAELHNKQMLYQTLLDIEGKT